MHKSVKEMSFKELSKLLEEISASLDEGGKEFVSISDDIVIAAIRLRQTLNDHQELARGTKVRND